MHDAHTVLEPCVISGWLNVFGAGKLSEPSKPLHRKRVNYLFLSLSDVNITVDGVFYFTPVLPHYRRLNMTVSFCQLLLKDVYNLSVELDQRDFDL